LHVIGYKSQSTLSDMSIASQKLAESLEVLQTIQKKGIVAIRSGEIGKQHKERLVKGGFLREVMKGWYIATPPNEGVGETTSWYTSFWHFCVSYLNDRFGSNWSLSPEDSLRLHAANRIVPPQLLVRAPKANNKTTHLLYDTSIYELRSAIPADKDLDINEDGLRLFSLSSALTKCSPQFFLRHPTEARTVLSIITDSSAILRHLLDGGRTTVAGNLAGAFRNVGNNRIADEITGAMRAAGYTVNELDPFREKVQAIRPAAIRSPYATRIQLMWNNMRKPIIGLFPDAPGLPRDIERYMKSVSDKFIQDAYNSLSIEGYRVSSELIERVRTGQWNPEDSESDRDHKNAMAARGYYQAFQVVQKSIQSILNGQNSGKVTDNEHGIWYRELFAPSVTSGLLKPSDLAGYRNRPVYIKGSRHVPPNHEAVRDVMTVYFELLAHEESPAVRAILGHFVFVYIHPYIDGNGRIGRFLMNAFLASGGYPWTIVPVEDRDKYMATLERASVDQDIEPFTRFIGDLVKKGMDEDQSN
jgi:hypothetical protein